MAQIRIFNQETSSYYTMDFNVAAGVLENTANGDVDYYLTVKTNIPTLSGGTFGTYVVRTLSDTPPGYGDADDFTHLCEMYYEYFTVTAQLSQSSESSSSESSSSSVGESSSSSYGNSESSSSEGYSESSSSS